MVRSNASLHAYADRGVGRAQGAIVMASIMAADESMQLGRVVQRTFGVFGRHFVLFIGLALLLTGLPGILFGLASGAVPGTPQAAPFTTVVGTVTYLVSLFGGFVLQAAIVRAVVADINSGRASFVDCLTTGMRVLLPVIGITILYMLGIMAGTLLLIVPGIVILLMWSVAVPSYVEERAGVVASLKRSRELTKGSRWKILGLYVVMLTIIVLIQMLVVAILGQAGTLAIVAAMLTSAVFGTLFAAMIASLYVELRQVKDGATPDRLAEVFA
jgi:MFS family permease